MVGLLAPAVEEDGWQFSRDELWRLSPSRMDGLDMKTETYFRKSFCTFLTNLGMDLKLPQMTIATAIVFCQRFYLRQSHVGNDRFLIATACMFLAGKVEETPRRLREVVYIAHELRYNSDPVLAAKIRQKKVFDQQKELILMGERLVLMTLNFDLIIHHPYKPLIAMIRSLELAESQLNAVAQVAWSFVNDGLRTSLCLQYKPGQVAAGAIFLAIKFLKLNMPSDGLKVWWHEFGITARQLEQITSQMLELYWWYGQDKVQGSNIVIRGAGVRVLPHTKKLPVISCKGRQLSSISSSLHVID